MLLGRYPLGGVTLCCRDLAESERFYAQLLGHLLYLWQPYRGDERYAAVRGHFNEIVSRFGTTSVGS